MIYCPFCGAICEEHAVLGVTVIGCPCMADRPPRYQNMLLQGILLRRAAIVNHDPGDEQPSERQELWQQDPDEPMPRRLLWSVP